MVDADPLLQSHISDILFIPKDVLEGGLGPFASPSGFDSQRIQFLQNVRHGNTMLVHRENHLHHFRFIGLQHNHASLIETIPICRRPAADSFFKPLADAPFEVFGGGTAFLLCKGCHHRQDHLGYRQTGINVLFFKKQLNAQTLQVPHIVQAFHCVARKTRNALGKDVIDFSFLTVLDHPKERFSVLHAGSADTFVSIDIDQNPTGMLVDFGSEGLHRLFKAGFLDIHVGADPRINGCPDHFHLA